MSYSIYIGDIDPNNVVDSVRSVRRNILFKLLLWDSIVLSDSQLLTDPRIALMMDGFSVKHADLSFAKKNEVLDWHKGFEELMQSGLIEVAHRRDIAGERLTMSDVWTTMKNNRSAQVPYLPTTQDYADFLDSTFYHTREYDLKKISARFKSNLHAGIANGRLLLDPDDATDIELTRILLQDEILFRDLLKVIRESLNKGLITQARYDEVYSYIYSCYQTNIPAEVNCSICTNFENLPLHLDLGYDSDFNGPEIDERRMRPTWALDPTILDLLPMDAFLAVRKAVSPHIKSGLIMKQKTGELLPEQLNEFYDAWADYTEELECALRIELVNAYEHVDGIVCKQFTSSQKRVKSGLLELIFNIAKIAVTTAAPITSLAFDIADYGKTGAETIGSFIMLNNKREMDYIVQQKSEMYAYIKKCMMGTKIITRYRD